MDYDENANLAPGYVAAVTTAIKRMLTERERQQLLVERRKTDQDQPQKLLAKKVVVDDKLKLASDKSQVSRFRDLCKICVVRREQQQQQTIDELSHHHNSMTFNGSTMSASMVGGYATETIDYDELAGYVGAALMALVYPQRPQTLQQLLVEAIREPYLEILHRKAEQE
ncbi:hypothetical protein pipiens_018158 [Culex pipiens pipiens]|uniref:Uncharacterized protein n=1 Tax=Culex pipiens pipiens TaxID=38569 RepID=A0ABD1CD66_CULPP